MKQKIVISILALLFSNFLKAQNDAEGCKDHSLLTRLENFYISACEQNYNELEIRTSSSKTEKKEGDLFYIYYRYNFDNGAKAKSALQIIRNYEVALTNNGGKLIYKDSDGTNGQIEATYYLSTKEKEYWIQLTSFAGTSGAVEAYALNVLEIKSMKQEVDATEMFAEINKKGFVALYINFETGKSEIQPASMPVIDQIFQMLKQNPDLKISIEGHTDNTGTEKSNQTLSEMRAKSVMNVLVSKGINANRLQSKGWGQTKPVADNNTEEGKAKNRRVEIVKL